MYRNCTYVEDLVQRISLLIDTPPERAVTAEDIKESIRGFLTWFRDYCDK